MKNRFDFFLKKGDVQACSMMGFVISLWEISLFEKAREKQKKEVISFNSLLEFKLQEKKRPAEREPERSAFTGLRNFLKRDSSAKEKHDVTNSVKDYSKLMKENTKSSNVSPVRSKRSASFDRKIQFGKLGVSENFIFIEEYDKDPYSTISFEDYHKYVRKYSLLSESHRNKIIHSMLFYSNLLYLWGHLEQRAILLKTINRLLVCLELKLPYHKKEITGDGIELGVVCTCTTAVDHFGEKTAPVCNKCNKFALDCVVCRKPVKGLSMFCSCCGHGGHALHIREWFSHKEMRCPKVGCGCKCKIESMKPPPPSPTSQRNASEKKKSSKPMKIEN